MSKHIDENRLREMITKYQSIAEKEYNPSNEDADFWYGKVVACEDILHIIDSIQQEQLEVDLEKIIEQTYHDGSVVDTDDMDHITYENIARHFYELGRRTDR